MSENTPTPGNEIFEIVKQLRETEARLQHLTGGQLDSVTMAGGRQYLLHAAQEKLRLSEAALQKATDIQGGILDALPAQIALVDRNGVILSVNEKWRQAAGPGQSLDANYLEICERLPTIEPGVPRKLVAGVRSVLRGLARQFSLEYFCQAPTEGWVQLIVTPLVEGGELEGAVVMNIDITERKRMEAALVQVELRHRSLFQNMLEAYIYCQLLYGEDGRPVDYIYLEVNEAFEPQTGLKDVVGKKAGEVVPGIHEANPEPLEVYSRVAATGKPEHFETYAQPLDIWFSISVYSHEKDHFIAVFENITQRKRAEAELKAKTVFLEAQVNSALSGILVVDENNRKILQNQRMVELFKIPPEIVEDVNDAPLLQWITSVVKNPDKFIAKVTHLYQHREEKSRDEIELNDGTILDRYSSPVIGQDGRHYGRIWTFRDITDQKKAVEVLRKSEAMLRLSSRVARLGGWTVDLADSRVTWSDEFCDIIEVPRGSTATVQEAIGYYKPSYREIIREAYTDCARYGLAFDKELELVTAKGRPIWVRAIGEAVRDAKGEITQLQGAMQDISARKAREQSWRLLNSAMLQSKESIVITDADIDWPGPRIVFVNPAFTQMTGYTEQEVLGQTPRMFQGPRTDRAVLDRLRKNLENGESFYGEAINYRKDGSEFNLEWHIAPVRDAEGKITHYVGLNRDVTERKRDEQILRESEARFRQLAENINEVFWIKDHSKNQLLYVSPAYETIWGRSREELYDQADGWAQTIHPQDFVSAQEGLARRQAGGNYNEVYRILRPDGSHRWIRDRAFPVKDEAGNIYRIVGVAEDITEVKRLESQYLRAQRMESIGTLAGGIAHDLNNILSPIVMSSSLLRRAESLESVGQIIPLIEESARRGADVVRQLLIFGRGVESERVVIQVRHLLKEMAKIVRETFPKSITFKSRLPNDLWPVFGDATQLHQVLLNLCVNARDAMPEGGILSLNAINVELDAAYAEKNPEAQPGKYLKLEVSDTGTGMSAEVIGKIFDPFFTTKPLGKGSGLGLSTVLGIVKNHHGFITVQSEIGRGTKFEIHLPATPDAVIPEPPKTAAVAKRGSGELVLLVDDEAHIVTATRKILESHGYTVVTAGDGIEALALFAREKDKIRLVVTDLLMPFLDGFGLVRGLKKMQPDIRIIVVSGVAADRKWEEKIAELEALGVASVLAKPFQPEVLLDLLHDLLH